MTVGTLIDLSVALENVSRETEITTVHTDDISRVYVAYTEDGNNEVILVGSNETDLNFEGDDLIWDEKTAEKFDDQLDTLKELVNKLIDENVDLKTKLKEHETPMKEGSVNGDIPG